MMRDYTSRKASRQEGSQKPLRLRKSIPFAPPFPPLLFLGRTTFPIRPCGLGDGCYGSWSGGGLLLRATMNSYRPRYYTKQEVSVHNRPWDLWVSYLGRVYDLSPLAAANQGDILMKPILEAAGKDISHWFNPKTKDIQTHIDPLTGCLKYYTPQGRFVHIPPPLPRSDWANDFGRPWWKDPIYEVGIRSAKTRHIRIINTLTSQEHSLEVCAEETMWEILRRYLPYNAHAASYTWKYEGVNLDMDKNLHQNHIPDEDEEFYQLNMDADLYTPAILLYFNDDLTEL